MCRNPAIPRSFSAQIEIQRHIVRYISALDAQSEPRSRCSITQLLDKELEVIRSDFADAWSGETEFHLLGAKLNLYAFCFAPQIVLQSSYDEQSHRLRGSVSSTAILYKGSKQWLV
jgi:hypothetical protein